MQLSETFRKALNRGGWLTVGLYAASIAVMGVVVGAVVLSTIGGMGLFSLAGAAGRVSAPEMLAVLAQVGGGLLLLGLIAIPAYLYIEASAFGSLVDAVEGRPVTFQSYIARGRDYFWRYLGYNLLYGLGYLVIVLLTLGIFAPGFIKAIITQNFFGAALGGLALANFLISAEYYFGFIPLVALAVAGYSISDFYRKHAGMLALGALAVWLVVHVPLVSLAAMPLLRLYVLSMRKDDDQTPSEADSVAADGPSGDVAAAE